jgi:hypothetical protein
LRRYFVLSKQIQEVLLRIIVSLIVLWGIVLSAGCQPNPAGDEPSATSTPVSPTQGDAEMTPSLPTPADRGLQSLIDKAVADLAQRLSIPLDQITLVEVTPVVWPDSSLGCPQPGMVYTQVLAPGYLILLEANDTMYEYHANRATYVTFCENPSPPVPGTPTDI